MFIVNVCWYYNVDIMFNDVKMVSDGVIGKYDRSIVV